MKIEQFTVILSEKTITYTVSVIKRNCRRSSTYAKKDVDEVIYRDIIQLCLDTANFCATDMAGYYVMSQN